LKIFKIDPLTATLTKAKTGQKAIGIAVDDMYAILSQEKLIDLTALEFRTALTKKFSQKRSYQKQKAKEIEENKSNESIILESQPAEIVTMKMRKCPQKGTLKNQKKQILQIWKMKLQISVDIATNLVVCRQIATNHSKKS
jgi:hypothetical protein